MTIDRLTYLTGCALQGILAASTARAMPGFAVDAAELALRFGQEALRRADAARLDYCGQGEALEKELATALGEQTRLGKLIDQMKADVQAADDARVDAQGQAEAAFEERDRHRAALLDAKESLADLHRQTDELAQFIMENVPGEPSRSEGAIACAIRILQEKLGVSPAPVFGPEGT